MEAEELKNWLHENGYTQRWLAERLGVTNITVNNWLSGRRVLKGGAEIAVKMLMNGGGDRLGVEGKKEACCTAEFERDVWERVCQEAERQGVSPRQFAEALAIKLAEVIAAAWVDSHRDTKI